MNPSHIERMQKTVQGNKAAIAAICSNCDGIADTLDILEKYDIKGQQVWCIYKHYCNGEPTTFSKFILEMKEKPSGICERGCKWGPSSFAPRTVCFNTGCLNEAVNYCSNCFSVRYCSVACQKKDWSEKHKQSCAQNVINIKDAIKIFGAKEASRRLYILGLLSEAAIFKVIDKYSITL
jgi:hypothetical protein